jgi:hypothetical protein
MFIGSDIHQLQDGWQISEPTAAWLPSLRLLGPASPETLRPQIVLPSGHRSGGPRCTSGAPPPSGAPL